MSGTAPEKQPRGSVPFDEYIAERNLKNARLVAILVAVLCPSGVVLDWATHREQVAYLFMLRLLAAGVGLILFWLTFRPFAIRHTFWLGALPVLGVAVAIELMIEHLEGYSSPYYAGLTHCLLALGVIFYWRVPQIVFASSLVIGVWLVPTLLQYRDVEVGPFANNFYALAVAAAIGIASNAGRYAAARREHEARTQLADAYSQLQELDHAKSQFFANVSHELRTPLTLILTPVTDLLGRGELTKADRSSLETVQRNAARLLRHIEELLELSQLDAGRRRLSIAPVDLRGLVMSQYEVTKPAADARSIKLVLNAPKDVPDVHADAFAIDIVLTNLLGNALKYTTDGGSITLGVEDGGDHGIVRVIDSGRGIPKEDLPRVFERFYQVDAQDRRREGAGIGLALAKELTTLHGGELSVESEVDRGSTFELKLRKGTAHFRPESVERRKLRGVSDHPRRRYEDAGQRLGARGPAPDLPTSAEKPEPIATKSSARVPGVRVPRVLVVEDQDDLRQLLKNLLEPEYEVTTAPDGRAALDEITKAPPDLVVSDIMMPRLSGTELCRHMKSTPLLRAIPIILLTARVGSEVTMDAYAHGADDFVAKPFHPQVLLARVRAQLRLRMLALQLVGREKAAVVGMMAAGVAHEVKNPLNAILNAGRALRGHDRSPELDDKLTRVIVDAASRIDSIVDALDSHTRPADPRGKRPFDPRSGVESSLLLLEHRMSGITVTRNFDEVPEVLAEVRAMNQAILNVLDNAVRSRATRIWVSITSTADAVVISVADDGTGVDPAIEKQIFDPFFTTREPGVGTGLGLHLASQIVAQHDGELWHEPRPEGGAVFKIKLPLASRTARRVSA